VRSPALLGKIGRAPSPTTARPCGRSVLPRSNTLVRSQHPVHRARPNVSPSILSRPVWKSNFAALLGIRLNHNLHAIDAAPARWRGGAVSSPLDGVSTAAFSLRAPDSLFDFRTVRDEQDVGHTRRQQPSELPFD
jgi:hypothetical protein